MSELILTKHHDVPDLDDIDVYIEHGGYRAWPKVLGEMEESEVIEVVSQSGLRGRGGAYFPTGRKWSLTVKDGGPNYLCCNADEGEPGTFKDRQLMERNPHELIEGCCIAAFANAAEHVYIYIRGEFFQAAAKLEKAIAQAYDRGYLGGRVLDSDRAMHVVVHRGAGAYICGEETSLLTSLDGRRAYPRIKPPFPGQRGLVERPSVVNNVETLANVPHIINNGAQWYRGFGTERAPGTKIFSVSGHVNKPANYEMPLGTPLSEIIFDCAGGIRDGKQVKAVLPGGSSTPFLTPDLLDTPTTPEAMLTAGSMLGSGAVIVMDEDTCIVNAARILAKFYASESCGQCTPCREGCPWLHRILERMEAGESEMSDLDLILQICDGIATKSLCLLGDSITYPLVSSIQRFRDEYERHIRERRCVPKANG
jgi:NADH-quinone oxidoreductase subunit F